MAEDVASIGVKFETDDIARGKASLEALAQQGPKVEKAMAGVEGAATPRLMKALADGISVPVGALRKMAEEGKLTSAVLSEALPKALGQLREEAKEVQTIGGAFTVLKNNIMEMVGAQSNASGTTKAFASGINALANNLDLLAAAGGAVAVVLGGALRRPDHCVGRGFCRLCSAGRPLPGRPGQHGWRQHDRCGGPGHRGRGCARRICRHVAARRPGGCRADRRWLGRDGLLHLRRQRQCAGQEHRRPGPAPGGPQAQDRCAAA